MHILISNDDGIFSPGLHDLANAALEAGHKVTIAAPSTQQSATSHRLTLNKSLMAHTYEFAGARAFAIDGTPVDCVRLGRYLADAPVDFCLSGINDGENIGSALFYSGTAAAAREATMLNIPAIAVSIGVGADQAMRKHLARIALSIMDRLNEKPLPRLTFCNLNAPALPVDKLKDFAVCPISDSYYLDAYVQRVNPRGVPYFWIEAGEQMEESRPGTDVALFKQGHVTCTFVGGFADNNHLYEGLWGTQKG